MQINCEHHLERCKCISGFAMLGNIQKLYCNVAFNLHIHLKKSLCLNIPTQTQASFQES